MTVAEVVELIKAVGGFVAIAALPLVTGYIMLSERRQRQRDTALATLGTKIDGMLKDRDASNVSKGERIGEQTGRVTADALAQGQREGREIERASGIARGLEHGGSPLPVADEAAQAIATRGVEATERLADATERKP